MGELREAIALCCKQLKLLANLADQAMTQEGGSNQEYLYNLLNNEVAYRRERRITKLLNTAGFPKLYTREQFHTDEIDFPEGVQPGFPFGSGFLPCREKYHHVREYRDWENNAFDPDRDRRLQCRNTCTVLPDSRADQS